MGRVPWETPTVEPVARPRSWRPVIAILAVLALLIASGALVRAQHHPDARHGVCRQAYAARIGHDPGDTALWLVLQDCARRGELPAGANNPGYYE